MKKIRLLLVDDHSLLRIGLNTLLSVQKDMEVVGEAEDGESAIRLARKLKPDVVIMDLMMPGLGGAEATRQILVDVPETRVLILTSYATSDELRQAVANGAAGIQTKGSPTTDLLKTIRAVASGKTVIPAEITAKGQSEQVSLSKRQKQILLAVSLGFNSEDIARQLGISVSGVKWNITDACEKLGAATRAEAAALAIRQHLLD